MNTCTNVYSLLALKALMKSLRNSSTFRPRHNRRPVNEEKKKERSYDQVMLLGVM